MFHRRLVFEGESAFDVPQLFRYFSDIDLNILEMLLRLRGGVAAFLGVGNDVVDGGPVLVRGLDAMAVTFIAPHSLQARPLVVPRGLEVTVRNATHDVSVALLVDGHRVSEVAPGGEVAVHLCDQRSLLATLPETTFFSRYRETFGP